MTGLDKDKVWSEVTESLRVDVSPAIYKTWISQTHLISLRKIDKKRYIAEIGCASSYVKDTMEKRYFGLTQEALIKTIGEPCDLTFMVKGLESQQQSATTAAPLFETRVSEDDLMEYVLRARLRVGFTFDNFAVSGSNQMAHAAAEAVADDPGRSYNPLFIWGGVGVGKTHLMHSVGYKVLERSSRAKILACTGEDFTNDIIQGIRTKTTQEFRNKYRKLDMLLIDDIQFIAGKDSVQEEFFHTFNAMTASGGQIIMTADQPPDQITKLEDRLLSRFQAGLVVDIGQPDFELRSAIVEIKTKEKHIPLTPQQIQLVAGNFDSAREIEGFLMKLSSFSRMEKTDITDEVITKLIGKKANEVIELKKRASSEDVITAVCEHFQVGKRSLLGKGRKKTIAFPRQILMYILRKELDLPLEEVGRIVGGRDHTTIMHGVDKITQLVAADVDTRGDISRIKRSL